MRLTIVEPWCGESHETFFRGVAAHSRHDATLVTLPARKWRWRMRTGAYHLGKQLRSPGPDALLVSDYVDLPDLKCFAPSVRDVPTAIYFLENQLTYPVRGERRGEFEFMATNLLSCLAADAVVFCTAQHRDVMLTAVPPFLAHDPDADGGAVARAIEGKSLVIPLGVDLPRFDEARRGRRDRVGKPLRIVWPHRFEHDKNPEDFCDVVRGLDEEGLPFELSFVGRSYRDTPAVLRETRERLTHRIAHFGFFTGREYAEALASADVVVSTARQETQGLAVIEAIRAGCDPLLPARLSYPEVLGPALAEKHLYTTKGELRRRLRWMMRHPDRVRRTAHHWREMERFGWPAVAARMDALFEGLAAG